MKKKAEHFLCVLYPILEHTDKCTVFNAFYAPRQNLISTKVQSLVLLLRFSSNYLNCVLGYYVV